VKLRVFIGSSAEQLELAYATQEALEHNVESTVWTQDVFTLSRSTIASLIDQLDDSDFGIFVLAPDDVTVMRDASKRTIRDNVIFELGLFIGRLGADRCFLIVPRGLEDLHLPSDLVGVTPATYDPGRQDGNLNAALGPACNRIRKAILRVGPLRPAAASEAEAFATAEELCSDPIDCQALIQGWMGARNGSQNRRAIRYSDVDRELLLVPGSARNYIQKAALHWGYEPHLVGKDTITFKQIDGY
jgi:Predicted nucleotide-binding protein containing TIR-like domain